MLCSLGLYSSVVVAQTGTQSVGLPEGWSSATVGSATSGTTISTGATSIVISGSGENIWGSADAFEYAYRRVTGDFDVTTRLANFDAANEFSKSGLMVRESLNANAKNAFTLFMPGVGVAFQSRLSTGGSTSRVDGVSATAPVWLRLVRTGSTFRGYGSKDGQTWRQISSATISMASTTYLGVAITSREEDDVAVAVFDER